MTYVVVNDTIQRTRPKNTMSINQLHFSIRTVDWLSRFKGELELRGGLLSTVFPFIRYIHMIYVTCEMSSIQSEKKCDCVIFKILLGGIH